MAVGKLVEKSSHSKQEIILDNEIDDILKSVHFLKMLAQVFNPHRLLILTALDRFGGLDFPALRDGVLINRSDGNLANHLRVLEDLELLEVEKGFVDRKPKTYYTLSTKGKDLVKELATRLTGIFGD
ncbi:MAG: transcriptional regulator [Nitrosopumilus sp.]|nr:transcriptional regulator [Nitrosopumilus sp.]